MVVDEPAPLAWRVTLETARLADKLVEFVATVTVTFPVKPFRLPRLTDVDAVDPAFTARLAWVIVRPKSTT